MGGRDIATLTEISALSGEKTDIVTGLNKPVLPVSELMEDFLGSHKSRPYHPLIANAFYRAGFIESWGRGIGKYRFIL